jgi:peptide/nickel transport system permease protein
MSFKEMLRRMKKSKFFMIGFILVVFLVLAAIFGPMIIQHDPYTSVLKARLTMPQWFSKGFGGHILGTDAQGIDILARLLYGSRVSLIISVSVVTLTAAIGTILGILAGFYGGKVDTIIMRVSEVQSAIPTMVFAIAVIAVLGNSITNLVVVLVITRWIQYTRIVRGNVMSIRKSEFVSASKVLGGSDAHIMFTQILPNVLTSLIIVMSQGFGSIILMESSLSFLGLGVPSPKPSWGGMIADGREYLSTAPWVVIAPGVALMIAVLAFNFLGDGIRDVLDPRNKD